MRKSELVKITQHRPFPLPSMPWVMQQTWKDLLFLHYKVPVGQLRKLVPSEFEIDTFNDEAYISISPFKMRNVRFRFLPPVPTAHNFLELNLRTYVKFNGRGGIYFISLDTSSTLSAIGARAAFLPYFRASMAVRETNEGFNYISKRLKPGKVPAIFEALYKPASDTEFCAKGTIDHWLMERYCLFQKIWRNRIIEIAIHHLPWSVQKAEVKGIINTLHEPVGLKLPKQEPLMHFAKYQKVLVWPPKIW